MKFQHYLFILVILLLFGSCKKEIQINELLGTWEVDSNDTLVQKSTDKRSIFNDIFAPPKLVFIDSSSVYIQLLEINNLAEYSINEDEITVSYKGINYIFKVVQRKPLILQNITKQNKKLIFQKTSSFTKNYSASYRRTEKKKEDINGGWVLIQYKPGKEDNYLEKFREIAGSIHGFYRGEDLLITNKNGVQVGGFYQQDSLLLRTKIKDSYKNYQIKCLEKEKLILFDLDTNEEYVFDKYRYKYKIEIAPDSLNLDYLEFEYHELRNDLVENFEVLMKVLDKKLKGQNVYNERHRESFIFIFNNPDFNLFMKNFNRDLPKFHENITFDGKHDYSRFIGTGKYFYRNLIK